MRPIVCGLRIERYVIEVYQFLGSLSLTYMFIVEARDKQWNKRGVFT